PPLLSGSACISYSPFTFRGQQLRMAGDLWRARGAETGGSRGQSGRAAQCMGGPPLPPPPAMAPTLILFLPLFHLSRACSPNSRGCRPRRGGMRGKGREAFGSWLTVVERVENI